MTSDPRVTLRDIANRLGISHSAVSLALRDSPRISTQLRLDVHRTAQLMGYHPNPMAAALGHLRGESIHRQVSTELAWLNCWKNPQQLRQYKEFDLYWRGAARAAEKYGYRLTEFVCNGEMPLGRLEKIFLARNIRGILLPPHGRDMVDLKLIDWSHFAAVRFGHSIKYPPVHTVTSDQLSNSLLAWDSLRRGGHERIGYITTTATELRTHFTAGFLMAQAEFPPKRRLPILFIANGEINDANLARLDHWLRKYRPQAILTEIAALAVMLEKIGWNVPHDVGLATLSVMDGNADSGIQQNSEEIGATAIDIVVSLINHNSYGIPAVCKKTLVAGSWKGGLSMTMPHPGRRSAGQETSVMPRSPLPARAVDRG